MLENFQENIQSYWFLNLMEFSHKKKLNLKKRDFLIFQKVEESYRNNLSDFNKRILKPAVEELKTLFENLKVERLKNGRVIKDINLAGLM